MPRKFVRIALEGGKFDRRLAEFYGIWAVHDYWGDWRVTHAPTGRAASRGLCQSTARLLAQLLAERFPSVPPKHDDDGDWRWIFEATLAEVEGA